MANVTALISDFVDELSAAIEAEVMDRARTQAAAVFELEGARPGRVSALPAMGRKRKKAPLQLCPVPGCKNPAAPVFGMVCSDHRDVSKAKIKQYREARRLAKAKGKGNSAAKRRGGRGKRRRS